MKICTEYVTYIALYLQGDYRETIGRLQGDYRETLLKNFPISRGKIRPPKNVHEARACDLKANGEIPGSVGAHTEENEAF